MVINFNIKKSRFSDAPWFKGVQLSDVTVGGIGNIGSWVSLYLARQGICQMYVYDFDNVDEVNLASQLYQKSDIGRSKFDALTDTLDRYADFRKVDNLGKLTDKNCATTNQCFSCFDNMEARKFLFENWYLQFKDDPKAIFIDGRLLAEIGQVFFVTPDRADDYRKTLFSDSEVPLENCAYKGTTHCSTMIASIMVAGFNNFIVNLEHKDLRNLPFNVDFQLPIFNFDVK